MRMDKAIREVILRERVSYLSKYRMEDLFGKTREDFEKEIDEMDLCDVIEEFENMPLVVEDFEEGGRWSNYRTRVYKGELERESVYIEVNDEVPASEMQDGGDFQDPSYGRVYPHKVEKTVFESFPQE